MTVTTKQLSRLITHPFCHASDHHFLRGAVAAHQSTTTATVVAPPQKKSEFFFTSIYQRLICKINKEKVYLIAQNFSVKFILTFCTPLLRRRVPIWSQCFPLASPPVGLLPLAPVDAKKSSFRKQLQSYLHLLLPRQHVMQKYQLGKQLSPLSHGWWCYCCWWTAFLLCRRPYSVRMTEQYSS